VTDPEGRAIEHVSFTEHVDTCLDSSSSEAKTLGQKEQVDVMVDGGKKAKAEAMTTQYIYIFNLVLLILIWYIQIINAVM